MKYGIAIDSARCMACYACFMACKDEHCGWDTTVSKAQPHMGQFWMDIREWERGDNERRIKTATVPTPCSHCDDPACMAAARDGAVYKRDDGIVIIDPVKAKGQKQIVDACPVGAVYWNEEEQIPQKCTMCAHLLDDGWTEPRCVQACPIRALSVVNCSDEDWEGLSNREELESLYPGKHKPKVRYKNLYRYNKCFIAGAAAYDDHGVETAATNARATIKKDGKTLETMYVDFLGEFKFDKLEPNSGVYTIEVDMPGFQRAVKEVELGSESPDIGVMMLERD